MLSLATTIIQTHPVAQANPSTWVLVLTSVGAGGIVGILGLWQSRKLIPKQKEELEVTIQKTAVETVEAALRVARSRIQTLEDQVTELTERIDLLRANLEQAGEEREKMRTELDLMLADRARLQQQIMDLNRAGKGLDGIGDLVITPPDAIITVGLADGIISYASEGVLSLLGYLPSDLIGKSIDMLVPEARRGAHVRERRGFAEQPVEREMGGRSKVNLEARTSTGGTLPVDISLHPTGDGRVLALVKRRPSQEPRTDV